MFKLLSLICCLISIFVWKSFGEKSFEENIQQVEYQYAIENWFTNIDQDLSHFNSLAAHLTWKLSTRPPDEKTEQKAQQLAKARNVWKNKVCQSNINIEWLTKEQKRKLYLLCRGPKFTDDDDMVLDYLAILGRLAQEYNSEICLRLNDDQNLITSRNFTSIPKPGTCLYGEPDLERQMKRTDLEPDQLKWIWLNWHNSVGPKIKTIYAHAIKYQNVAARNNGYKDMGEIWREELEIPNLEEFVQDLYREIEPLYMMLHAVIRHKLYQKYGPREIDPTGPIPIHLLGNMWGQDWSPLIDLFNLTENKIDLNKNLKKKNMTVKEMVIEAEDFYTSMNLPKMTKMFWKYSIFQENENTTICHGTAANLYTPGDYRMLMCGKVSLEDFYVIHHELGHIEYYMAYEDQPAFFQDGTNTAFHESIGDAIMHGVMTPQHLHRLALISDEQLGDKSTELYLLFLQALSKIPEIPFSLIIDMYRWDIFRGAILKNDLNSYYWRLNLKYRGIVPPGIRGEEYFDAGAKFHIPDNTPYIRYFLSSIIQMQIFKSLCEISMYGKKSQTSYEQEYLPLHRCDIYGSKTSGKKLWMMMKQGASVHWTEALNILSGVKEISTKAFLDYYQPIYYWLENYIKTNNVYVGW